MRTNTIASPAVAMAGNTRSISNANAATGTIAPSAAAVAMAGPTTFTLPATTDEGTGTGGGSEGDAGVETGFDRSGASTRVTTGVPTPRRPTNSSIVLGR